MMVGVVGWADVECSRNQDQSDYPDLAGWFLLYYPWS